MPNEELKKLQDKLASIQSKQDSLSVEILQLKNEISKLSRKQNLETPAITPDPVLDTPAIKPVVETVIEPKPQPVYSSPQPIIPPPVSPSKKSDLEKFIGENLISKIGILVLIIGVGMGVKYAIDNDLASPAMRIVFGYVCSLSLLGIAIKLKKKYENFSAVLFSGGIASAYFTTYFASIFYDFFPREIAFPIMVLMTAGTVSAAIWYKKEVIAHIGLWGAYAVPVLLGSGSNKTEWLFLYILIINIGMLVVSYWRKWTFIYLNAFLSSWMVFLGTVIYKDIEIHAKIDLAFASAFFALFLLAAVLFDRRKDKSEFQIESVLAVVNGIIYAAIGSYLMYTIYPTQASIGIFLFIYAAIYFVVSSILYAIQSRQAMFKALFSLGLIALVIAIPIEFMGLIIPLFWTIIIILLHALKRYTQQTLFESYSIPLYVFVIIGSFVAWGIQLPDITSAWKPLLRLDFLWSILLVIATTISYLILKTDNPIDQSVLKNLAGVTLIILLYSVVLFEIISFFRMKYLGSFIIQYMDKGTPDQIQYNIQNNVYNATGFILSLAYSLVFLFALNVYNIYIQKSKLFYLVQQVVLGFLGFITIILGFAALYSLDQTYLQPKHPEYYPAQTWYICLRYILFAACGLLVYGQWLYTKKGFVVKEFRTVLSLSFHAVILIFVSNEILHWGTISYTDKLDKYGLSIFWGLYALLLVGYGIWKNNKIFRIAGIVVLGITLVKLFFYDIAGLGNIIRILLFLAIGALMLFISFLYNKYKDKIDGEPN